MANVKGSLRPDNRVDAIRGSSERPAPLAVPSAPGPFINSTAIGAIQSNRAPRSKPLHPGLTDAAIAPVRGRLVPNPLPSL